MARNRRAQYPDSIDVLSGSFSHVDFYHRKIHEGEVYAYSKKTIIGDGESIEFLLTTPAGSKEIHLFYHGYSSLKGLVDIYEDANASGGTPCVPMNRYRKNGTSIATSTHTPSVDSDMGTELPVGEYIGQDKKAGGEVGGHGGIILNVNTKYLIRLESLEATNYAALCLFWIEHIPKTTTYSD